MPGRDGQEPAGPRPGTAQGTTGPSRPVGTRRAAARKSRSRRDHGGSGPAGPLHDPSCSGVGGGGWCHFGIRGFVRQEDFHGDTLAAGEGRHARHPDDRRRGRRGRLAGAGGGRASGDDAGPAATRRAGPGEPATGPVPGRRRTRTRRPASRGGDRRRRGLQRQAESPARDHRTGRPLRGDAGRRRLEIGGRDGLQRGARAGQLLSHRHGQYGPRGG